MARWGSRTGVLLVNFGLPSRNGMPEIRSYVSDVASCRWLMPGGFGFIGKKGAVKAQGAEALLSVLDGRWSGEGWSYDHDHMRLVQGLNGLLSEQDVVVRCGMLFGSPSVSDGVEKLGKLGCDSILVVPMDALAPMGVMGVMRDRIREATEKAHFTGAVSYVEGYFRDSLFLRAQAASVLHAGFRAEAADRLLLLFRSQVRGVLDQGEASLLRSSGYVARALAKLLGVTDDRVDVAFCRPFGNDLDWTGPAAADELKDLATGEWAAGAEGRLFLAWPEVAVDGYVHRYDLGQSLTEGFVAAARAADMPRDEGDVVPIAPLGRSRANLKVLQQVILQHLDCA